MNPVWVQTVTSKMSFHRLFGIFGLCRLKVRSWRERQGVSSAWHVPKNIRLRKGNQEMAWDVDFQSAPSILDT